MVWCAVNGGTSSEGFGRNKNRVFLTSSKTKAHKQNKNKNKNKTDKTRGINWVSGSGSYRIKVGIFD